MHYQLLSAFLVGLTTATVAVYDPSDTINPADWAADNAILANYNVTPILYQIIPVVGPNVYNGTTDTFSHQSYFDDGNDTSAVIITDGAQTTISFSEIVKYGYASNLLQSSFFGINAAVNVANGSIARLNDINITTHNGAANLYAFGTGSVAYVNNAWLYSSGPVAHGLYAGGNGTVYGNNILAYSGGNRCSIFSGDNPAGYINIDNAVVHTDGIGSAVCYALGLCNMTNVVGHASRSPAMFSDGPQTGIWTNSDLTAGLLAGVVMFSSMMKSTGAHLTLDHTRLTTLGADMPGLWFGNIGATAEIISSTINTTSNILAVANYSQVTQDFDFFADYRENANLMPADLAMNVMESDLVGDLVAYNGSTISINLTEYSSWTGNAYSGYGQVEFGVYLDATSNWTLTGNVTLQNFSNADTSMGNVASNGFVITYNSSSEANGAMGGKTVELVGGGKVVPL